MQATSTMDCCSTPTTSTSSIPSAQPLLSATSSPEHRHSSEDIITASAVLSRLSSHQNITRRPLRGLGRAVFPWAGRRCHRLGLRKEINPAPVQTAQAGCHFPLVFSRLQTVSLPRLPRRQVPFSPPRNMLVIWDVESGKSLYGAANK